MAFSAACTGDTSPTSTPVASESQANPAEQDLIEAGHRTANSIRGDRAPAVAVDGEVITTAELDAARERVRSNIEFMNGVIDSGQPAPAVEGISERLSLIEAFGVENVALASEIRRSALVAEAAEREITLNEEMLTSFMNELQRIVADGDAPSLDSAISEIGEGFWGEELRSELRETRLEVALLWLHTSQADSMVPPRQRRNSFIRSAVEEAEIEVLDASALKGATVSSALQYLSAYLALDSQQSAGRSGTPVATILAGDPAGQPVTTSSDALEQSIIGERLPSPNTVQGIVDRVDAVVIAKITSASLREGSIYRDGRRIPISEAYPWNSNRPQADWQITVFGMDIRDVILDDGYVAGAQGLTGVTPGDSLLNPEVGNTYLLALSRQPDDVEYGADPFWGMYEIRDGRMSRTDGSPPPIDVPIEAEAFVEEFRQAAAR